MGRRIRACFRYHRCAFRSEAASGCQMHPTILTGECVQIVEEDVRTKHALVGNRGRRPGRVTAPSCPAAQASQGLRLFDSGLRFSRVLRRCWALAGHQLRGKYTRFLLFAISLYLRLPAGRMGCIRTGSRSDREIASHCDGTLSLRTGSYFDTCIADRRFRRERRCVEQWGLN